MNIGILGATDDLRSQRFYHGTRADLKPGDLIDPGNLPDAGERDGMTTFVYLTPNLDAAIWGAELAVGEGPGRVYIVEPTGQIEDVPAPTGQQSPGNPTMSYRSREPLRVTGEVTEWRFYHGTRADLKPGDLIKPGQRPNFGKQDLSQRPAAKAGFVIIKCLKGGGTTTPRRSTRISLLPSASHRWRSHDQTTH